MLSQTRIPKVWFLLGSVYVCFNECASVTISFSGLYIHNVWADTVYVIVCICVFCCVLVLWCDNASTSVIYMFHMCVLAAAQCNPPGDHQFVSVWENNKYEMEAATTNRFLCCFCKLRGRDEFDGWTQRDRKTDRETARFGWSERSVGRGGDSKRNTEMERYWERHIYCNREWGEWKTAKRWQESN